MMIRSSELRQFFVAVFDVVEIERQEISIAEEVFGGFVDACLILS